MYRLSQALVTSLKVSRGPKHPFPGVWQLKVWSAVLERGLSGEVGENLCGDLSQQNLQVARCDGQGKFPLGVHCEKVCSTAVWLG